jgi:hypothetical protein
VARALTARYVASGASYHYLWNRNGGMRNEEIKPMETTNETFNTTVVIKCKDENGDNEEKKREN